MKNSLTLPSLANKYLESLGSEEDICTYNDEEMTYFVRQSIKGGRSRSFNQYYKSSNSDNYSNII